MNKDQEDLPYTEAQKLSDIQKAQEVQTDVLEELLRHVESDNYIPWETVTLPSRGVYYGDRLPDGKLEVKPMGQDVDKMLVNQRLAQSGELMNKIVESCTRLPPDLPIYEMLSGDFNFLIYYIRGITHGNDYEFSYECPHCGTKNICPFDLNEMFMSLKGPKDEYLEEPIRFRVPYLSESFKSDVYAHLNLVRVSDIVKMTKGSNSEIFDPVKQSRVTIRNREKELKKKKKTLDTTEIYERNMVLQIRAFEVDGKKLIGDKKNVLINHLHQRDTSAIREFLDDISPGIDTMISAQCTNEDCQEITSMSLPWGENFFRPSKR